MMPYCKRNILRDEKGAEATEVAIATAILVVGLLAVIAFNEQAWSNRTKVARCQYQDWHQQDPANGAQGPMVWDENLQVCVSP